MTKKHVQERWPLYCLLTKIMYASINDKIILNDPDSPVSDFPKNNPREWANWALGVNFILSLDETVEITNSALKNVTKALAATHNLAAAIKVSSPSEDIIKSLTENLKKLNEVIKADQKFHAALDIGEALAGEIEKRSKIA